MDGAIWSFERPLWFSGVRLWARTTIVRLEDGALLLHSPAPISDAVAEQLRPLGEVRWLMIPNAFHHLGTPAAAARFPQARVLGPASASKKNASLALDTHLESPGCWEQLRELEPLPLRGVPFLDETVLYHRPTQSLLGADVVIRASARDHWTLRLAARATGFYERVRVPPDVKGKIADSKAAAQSLEAMIRLPARRLVVAHATVIEGDCCERLAEAWRLEGVGV